MEVFDFSQVVEAERGIHDCINWSILDAFRYWGDAQTTDNLMERLGNFSERRSRMILTEEQAKRQTGWMFTASKSDGRVEVRKRELVLPRSCERVTKPLFSGEYRTRSLQGKKERAIDFHLEVNPTRFIRHHVFPKRSQAYEQELKNAELALENPWLYYELLTQSADSLLSQSGESSYDKLDNWIGLGKRAKGLLKSERVREEEERFFFLLDKAMTGEWKRATNKSSSPIKEEIESTKGKHNHSLQAVSTYWEFLHEEPILFVKRLEPLLRTYNENNPEEREYGFQTREEVNSTHLKLCLRKGVSASVLPLAMT